jgi:hypothetical protein
VGVLDFINAFARGTTLVTPGDFGATYFIPMMIVPPLMVTHLLIIARLQMGFASSSQRQLSQGC